VKELERNPIGLEAKKNEQWGVDESSRSRTETGTGVQLCRNFNLEAIDF